MKQRGSARDPLWFKDAVIYETHVKSFFDGNNDGIGDFTGLIQKLDYVHDLGATCLWLLPFFPSPLRDDGYDIADYTGVHPSYGSLEDFQKFLAAAHERDIQVLIELVVNHTSDQHSWFQAARQAPLGSPEREYYVWSDTDQKYKDTRIIFTDTEKSNWAWDESAQAYYWHRFFSHQPDLNFDNPTVVQKVIDVMRFWLDMGVDGMRLDAIPYLVERDGTNCENLAETHTVIKQIRSALDAQYDNRLFLAEANQWPADVRAYFGESDECHMAFHFPLMPRIFMALRLEDRHPITEIMGQTPAIPDSCQWGLFLRNHDELTLEMVTDEERDYMYFAYSADPKARINVGIRRRLAPLMDNSRRRIELMNALLLSFPGTPIIYYGDEIGMGDNIYLGDRNGVRTPMQWSPDRNAGFSRCNPAQLYHPVIMDPIYGYEAVNVEAQHADPSSLLSWMRNMIALRKLFKVFGRGGIEFLFPTNRKVLAYLREHDGDRILCVANLSRFAQAVELDLGRFSGLVPVEMLGYVEFPRIGELPYLLTLGPYGFYWFELQTAAAPIEVTSGTSPAQEDVLMLPADGAWASFFEGDTRKRLEDALLPAFLMKQRWFGGKGHSIEKVTIVDAAVMVEDREPVWMVVLSVDGDGGTTEQYAVPLAVAMGPRGGEIDANSPQAVVGRVTDHLESGVLFDGMADDRTCHTLLDAIQHRRQVPTPAGQIDSFRTPGYTRARGRSRKPFQISRPSGEQSNTSIIYGDRLILKLFRRLHVGPNPDVELLRYLVEQTPFARVPLVAGGLEYHPAGEGPSAMAVLQQLVPNQGDGWKWMVAELERYFEGVVLAGEPPPVEAGGLLLERVDRTPGPVTQDAIGLVLEMASTLGNRTAELHHALASPTDDPAFAPEPLTPDDCATLATTLAERAIPVFVTLKRNLAKLPDELSDHAGRVLSLRRRLLDRFDALRQTPVEATRTRIHGDYHLGQVLVAEHDFFILDFEGEPARPLAARRAKASPMQDVAGMLRSFSYAAHAGVQTYVERHPDAVALIHPWARLWEDCVTAAYLRGYLRTAADASFVPKSSTGLQVLLDVYLLDKALYELRYELDNRPAWAQIPIAGLLGIAGVSSL